MDESYDEYSSGSSSADEVDMHGGRDRSYFDSGTYRFNKLILALVLKELPIHYSLTPLPEKLSIYQTKDHYYDNFLPHILEEARAILAAGYEAYRENKLQPFTMKVGRIQTAKNQENPATVIANGKLPEGTEGRSCLALLLRVEKYGLLALASEEGIDTGHLRIKFLTDSNLSALPEFNNGQQWHAYVLGSLISCQRMYEVCTAKPEVGFLRDVISGELSSWEKRSSSSLSASFNRLSISSRATQAVPVTIENLKALNASQQQAAQKFVDAGNGLYVLQGPPGTGKTTTIAEILKTLADRKKRVLLCAPSNKAVQVIASRFLRKYPDVAMALAGVESKLTENLREIFIQGWGPFMASRIIQFKRNLFSQLNLSNLLNMNLKNFEQIKKNILHKLAEISANPLIKITNSVADRSPKCYDQICRDVKSFDPFLTLYKEFLGEISEKNIVQYREYLNLLAKQKKSDDESFKIEKPDFFSQAEVLLQKLVNYLESIIGVLKKYDAELDMLNHARIIFCTLSVAGRSMMQKVDEVDVLVVDEAGQSVEAETLIAFSLNPKKCLLVGDVKQLPATVISTQAEQKNFSWSMMGRLLEKCKQPYEMLTIQYRMHPDIRSWPSQQYYNDRLQDGENINTRILPYPVRAGQTHQNSL